MKVTCEYCDSVVDAENNDTCPNCGAPLTNSRKVREAELNEERLKKEAEEREERKRQQKLEQERIEAERGKMILDAVTNLSGARTLSQKFTRAESGMPHPDSCNCADNNTIYRLFGDSPDLGRQR